MEGPIQFPNITQVTQSVAPSSATISSTSVPPSIAVLPVGSLLRGIIVDRQVYGHHNSLLLKTDKGELRFQTDIPIKRGMEVMIRLEKLGSELLARVISINGKSPNKYLHSLPGSEGHIHKPHTPAQPSPSTTTKDTTVATKEIVTPLSQQKLHISSNSVHTPLVRPLRGEAILLSTPQNITEPLNLSPAVSQALKQSGSHPHVTLHITQINAQNTVPTTSQTQASLSNASSGTHAQVTAPPNSTVTTETSVPNLPKPLLPQPSSLPQQGSQNIQNTPSHSTQTAIPSSQQPIPTSTSKTNVPTQTPTTAPIPANNVPTPSNSTPTTINNITTQLPALQTTTTTAPSNASQQIPPQTPPQTIQAIDTAKPEQVPAKEVPLNQFTGVVKGGDKLAGLTIQSPLGTFRLLNNIVLPPATQVTFTIENVLPAPTQPFTTPDLAPKLSGLSEILELKTTLPTPPTSVAGMSTGATPYIVPQTGSSVTTELIFLMSALKGGDIRQWLGEDNHRKMETEKPELLRRITTDFSLLRTQSVEAREPGQWNSLLLPFGLGDEVETLRLFYRHGQGGNTERDQKNDPGEHFVVDLHLSHMGAMQLDGFIRKQPENYLFDLVIRSEHPIKTVARQGIQDIYAQGQEISGFAGTIRFHSGKDAIIPLAQLDPDIVDHQSLTV